MKHRHGPTSAALLAVVLLVAPLMAGAQVVEGVEPGPAAELNPGKLFDLAMCAVSIMAIETGVGAVVAGVVCARTAVMWWSV